MIYDVAIIGAGIAGASLAATLDPQQSVILIEQETEAGYHATGRSASFWDECYGGPDVQPLTTASGPFLHKPPKSFSDQGFLTPRGVLYIGRADDCDMLSAMERSFNGSGVALTRLAGQALNDRVPLLKPEWTSGVYGSACCDIDVGRLHAAYLAQARRSGAQLCLKAPVERIDWRSKRWHISTPNGQIEAGIIVNAAGAWADHVAAMAGLAPLGITPFRRTVSQVRVNPSAASALPLVIDINGGFYFKPEAGGRLWLSPHDETVSPACDAAPEELDIALAISRFESAMNCRVEGVEHSWAGLRSFAPDRLPVYGFDPDHPAFFWCAGQGGFGIQTAPAAAHLCAAMMGWGEVCVDMSADLYTPSRFR
jgi:D-arginine dehydrogenase